jgi:fucose permease
LVLDLYPHARGGALNRFHFLFSLGALLSPVVVGQLVTAGIPWRAVVLASGVGIIAFAALFGAARMPSGRRVRALVMSPGETFTRAEQSLLPFAGLAIGICCYIAAEMGVSSWLVRSPAGIPVATATVVLSIFWGGSALGRLLSNWIAERLDYGVSTVGCIVLGSGALVAAVLVPLLPLAAALYGLAGLCYGPVYPMILAIGGTIYPQRLAALSGSLGAAAVVGSVVYPPLIGLMATPMGLRAGLVGAGLLGVPTALAIMTACAIARRSAAVPEDPALEAAS